MEKKVFKTGEIITPEFMNQLQDAIKETESEVGEHYGEFEELVTALMRVFTSNFDTYSVSKDGYKITIGGATGIELSHVSRPGEQKLTFYPGELRCLLNDNSGFVLNRQYLQFISENLNFFLDPINKLLTWNVDNNDFINISPDAVSINIIIKALNGLIVDGGLLRTNVGIQVAQNWRIVGGNNNSLVLQRLSNNGATEDCLIIRSDGFVTINKGLRCDDITYKKIKPVSGAIPTDLTPGDDCDTLESYENTYGESDIVYRMASEPGTHTGDLSSKFYLNGQDGLSGRSVTIFNVGNYGLTVRYEGLNGESQNINIPIMRGRKFMCAASGPNLFWLPID